MSLEEQSGSAELIELVGIEDCGDYVQTFDTETDCHAERYKFHKCTVGFLPRIAETCEFSAYRDDALRDRLVCPMCVA